MYKVYLKTALFYKGSKLQQIVIKTRDDSVSLGVESKAQVYLLIIKNDARISKGKPAIKKDLVYAGMGPAKIL